MILNKFIHSFLHSYKRKYLKRQYVNEILKFHIFWFSIFRPWTSPPFFACENRNSKFNKNLSTNLRTRYVRLFSCLYGQSNDDATIEKTIFSTNCRFIFTDVRNGYTRRLLFDMLENWKPFSMKFIIDIYMSVCRLTIASSSYIYPFCYVLFSVPIILLHCSIGSFYCFNFLISFISFSGFLDFPPF